MYEVDSYCTEYGIRADTGQYAYLFRCNPTKGDYMLSVKLREGRLVKLCEENAA